MTTKTLTLTDFLLARIAEDEAAANPVMEWPEAPRDRTLPWEIVASNPRAVGWGLTCVAAALEPFVADHIARHDPARVLAECDAKRLLVAQARDVTDMDQRIESEWGTRGTVPFEEDEGIRLLRYLALPYVDHADYRDEWRPCAR